MLTPDDVRSLPWKCGPSGGTNGAAKRTGRLEMAMHEPLPFFLPLLLP